MKTIKIVDHKLIDKDKFTPEFLNTIDTTYCSNFYLYIISHSNWVTSGLDTKRESLKSIIHGLNALTVKELTDLISTLTIKLK
jgi:hypothetical protein